MRTSPTCQRPRKPKLAARRSVSTTDTNGFYQHSMNGDTAPPCFLIPLFPTLVCDSFVTLGVDCDRGGSTTDPDFDSAGFNTSGTVSGGWFNSAPANGQGDPNANGRVMIARFSYKQNKNTSGDVCVFTKLAGSDDITEFLVQPFDCSTAGMQGDPPSPGGPTIRYVDDTATGANNGTNWGDAFTDLQDALAVAQATDQIWVAAGTYKPVGLGGPRTDTFQLINGVAVYGGFFGTPGSEGDFGARDPDPATNGTTLSGDLAGDDLPVPCTQDADCNAFGRKCANGFCIVADKNDENSYHVVTGSFAGLDGILDGFTITAGNANGQGGPKFCFSVEGGPNCCDPDMGPCGQNDPPICAVGRCVSEQRIGGGMIIKGVNSEPTVTNCTFRGNTVAWAGGGMYVGFADPTITDCTFISNLAGEGAGGMCNNFESNSTVSNCLFIGNTANTGGGMANLDRSSPTVTNCIFSGNSASVEGGAFYDNTGSNPLVTHCTFSGNTAASRGAGMLNTASGPTLINCTFSGNKLTGSASFGGAIQSTTNSSGTTTNCLFAGNSANSAGAMLLLNSSSTTLTNCTFAGNSAATNGGGLRVTSDSSATVDNCLFWGNSDGGGTDESAQIFFTGDGVTVTYTDIMGLIESGPFCVDENGEPPCEGNINADPKFLGGASGNWDGVAVFNSTTGQTTFTDTNAAYSQDELVDNFLNPDTAQFLQSLIVSNTQTTVTVWGDFKVLGNKGITYQINDYRLDSPLSPCIDAADNNPVTLCGLDLDGNERFVDDPATPPTGNPPGEEVLVDMGAYEFGSQILPDCNGNAMDDGCELSEGFSPDCNTNGIPDECDIASGTSLDCQDTGVPDDCCPADFDGDEAVGAFDLATLLGAWGVCADCEVGVSTCGCQADLDNNCNVEAFDLASLLGSWGPCP